MSAKDALDIVHEAKTHVILPRHSHGITL